ncbi:hypothetical protein F4808DRAFT_230060 [Astrocystis sublimbata]|nr:hypothetical protein F4808DRAFT_230060 [Astrocystis sublimbata]
MESTTRASSTCNYGRHYGGLALPRGTAKVDRGGAPAAERRRYAIQQSMHHSSCLLSSPAHSFTPIHQPQPPTQAIHASSVHASTHPPSRCLIARQGDTFFPFPFPISYQPRLTRVCKESVTVQTQLVETARALLVSPCYNARTANPTNPRGIVDPRSTTSCLTLVGWRPPEEQLSKLTAYLSLHTQSYLQQVLYSFDPANPPILPTT